MRTTSLTGRVLVAGLLLLACVLGAGVAVGLTEAQLRGAETLNRQLSVATGADTDMLNAFVDEETGYRGYLLTGSQDFLAPYTRARRSLPKITAVLRQNLAASGGPVRLLRDLEAAHGAWLAHVHQQLDLVRSGRRDQAIALVATGRGKAQFDTIRRRNDAVVTWLDGASAAVDRRTSGLQQRLAVLLSVALAVLAVLVVGGSLLLWTSVARPLARLAAATRAVAGGDLGADLPAGGAFEVRSLASDVRAMRNRLTADLHATRRSLEALEQAEPTVAALRAALRPGDGRVPGLSVAARLDPAEGVLAGDWYDTVDLGSGRLGLVVGDVAGHGPTSAVFALRLKHSLIAALRAGLDPGQSLTQVWTELADVPAGQFATVLVAILDTVTDTLTYANAGHPAGLLLGGAAGPARAPDTDPPPDGERRTYRAELAATGPLLSSIVLGRGWTTRTRAFGPGDVLLVFTDGVPETRDRQGREFGTRGILGAVTEVGFDDGERLVAAIAAASMRFGGNRPRRDDLTIVYVQRTAGIGAAAEGFVSVGAPAGLGAEPGPSAHRSAR